MTIQQFGDATHYVQRTVLEMLGTYLLTKKTHNIVCRLYQVDNFYVEVQTSSLTNTTPLFTTYSVEAIELDNYLDQIDLSLIEQLLD
jgi:hypothetical protein